MHYNSYTFFYNHPLFYFAKMCIYGHSVTECYYKSLKHFFLKYTLTLMSKGLCLFIRDFIQQGQWRKSRQMG